jgi:hypothetical protein
VSHPDDIYLVWFDGEEAFGEWSYTNGIYGSRHLPDKWSHDGTLTRIKALINIDMIGDKDLDILEDTNSSRFAAGFGLADRQRHGLRQVLPRYRDAYGRRSYAVRSKGVNALDLIDFDYGPNNAYWHDKQDTIDKVSAHSLEAVGNVLVAVLRKLQCNAMDLRHRDWRNHRKALGADRYLQNLETKIDRYFRLLRLPAAEIQVTHLVNKGGLEMTEADRSRVLETARENL